MCYRWTSYPRLHTGRAPVTKRYGRAPGAIIGLMENVDNLN